MEICILGTEEFWTLKITRFIKMLLLLCWTVVVAPWSTRHTISHPSPQTSMEWNSRSKSLKSFNSLWKMFFIPNVLFGLQQLVCKNEGHCYCVRVPVNTTPLPYWRNVCHRKDFVTLTIKHNLNYKILGLGVLCISIGVNRTRTSLRTRP